MEAVSVVNRTGGQIRQFIFPSSVSAYGSETAGPVKEDAPLRAHTLPYAIPQRECDEVVRYRAESLGDFRRTCCVLTSSRAPACRLLDWSGCGGTPLGSSKRAARMRASGKRLPGCFLAGHKYREKRFQFVLVTIWLGCWYIS